MTPLGEITQLTEEIPMWLALVFALGTGLMFLGFGEGLQKWAIRRMPSGRLGSDLSKEIRQLRIALKDHTQVVREEHRETRRAIRDRLSELETRVMLTRRDGA